MLNRLLDLYLLLIVCAGAWIWSSGPWPEQPLGYRPLVVMLMFAAIGWSASFGRGQRLARLMIRAVAAIAASAIVAAMAAAGST